MAVRVFVPWLLLIIGTIGIIYGLCQHMKRTIITLVVITPLVVFWVVYDTFTDDLTPHTGFHYDLDFRYIMDQAVEYHYINKKWPESITKDLPRADNRIRKKYFTYTCYTEKDSLGNELFVAKATSKVYLKLGKIPKGYFVTLNNIGNKSYNHRGFEASNTSFLKDATYVGDGKE